MQHIQSTCLSIAPTKCLVSCRRGEVNILGVCESSKCAIGLQHHLSGAAVINAHIILCSY